MAISKGRTSEGSNSFKHYTGIDQFNVLGVNPDLATLNSWGVNMQKEPEYLFNDEDGTRGVRIHFWVKSKSIPDFITRIEFRLRNRKNETTKGGVHKTQFIDKYGNSAWLTDAEAQNKTRPVSKSGKAQPFCPDVMRPSRPGEAALTEFIKYFVNIDDSHRYVDQRWTLIDDADDKAGCMLDHIADYFNGDVTELRESLAYQPENTVQLLCGVRSGSDGRIYQEVYSDRVCRAASKQAVKVFSEEIAKRKSAGGLQSSEFTFGGLKEWEVKTATPEEIDAAVSQSDDDDDDLPFA